jgi:hypothetical protein
MINLSSIIESFLRNLDENIQKNIATLSCSDIKNAYDQLFESSKQYRGNSNGFTGLAEFLVFRVLYHSMGEVFTRSEYTDDTYAFSSDNIEIGQNLGTKIKGKRYVPDILICKKRSIVGIVQIKTYITNGTKEVKKELATFDTVHFNYPSSKGVLVVFNRLSKRGTILPLIENEVKSRKWLNYLMLDSNPEPLSSELLRLLSL